MGNAFSNSNNGINIVSVICKKCKDLIYSRAKHDLRVCSCGNIEIDGGRECPRISYKDDSKYQINTFNLELTEEQLYEDWNSKTDKYGLIKNQYVLEDIIFGGKKSDEI